MDILQRLFRYRLSVLLVALLYLLIATACLRLATLNSSTSPFWPASGLAFLVLLYNRSRGALGVWIGALVANLINSTPLSAAVIIACGNLGEALLATALYQRILRMEPKTPIAYASLALALSAMMGALVSAAMGALALSLSSGFRSPLSFMSCLTWWVGDLAGILVIVPAFQVRGLISQSLGWSRLARLGLVLASLALAFGTVFGLEEGGFAFILLLPVLIAAFLLESGWSILTAATLSVSAIIAAAQGLGPFQNLQMNENLLGFQMLICCLMLSTQCITDFLRYVEKQKILPLLGLGWFLSGWLFHNFHSLHREKDERHLRDLAMKVEQRVIANIETYENVLQDFAAMIATFPRLTQQEWSSFFSSSRITDRLTEMTGIGFVARIPYADRKKFEKARQQDGSPGFTIKSGCEPHKGPADFYAVVQYIDPLEKNSKALGFDVSCEKNRSLTLDRARMSDLPVMTPPIYLVQDEKTRPGLLLYAPVHSQDRFLGWISGIFTVDTMMKKLLASFEAELHFTIRPVLAGSSSISPSIYVSAADLGPPELSKTLILSGQAFTFEMGRSATFQSSKNLAFAWVGCLGVLLTLAIGYLMATHKLIHQRTKDEVNRQMQSIAARDRLWQTLTEFAPVGIFQVSAAGEPTFSNKFWLELVGGLVDGTTAEERWNRVHPEDRLRIQPLWRNLLQQGSIMREELRLLRPEGVTWVKVHSAPILGEGGKIEGFVGVALDITERKLKEAEVEKERIKVIQSSKMASLGEMASGIAHEINNPLAVINAIACHLKLKEKYLPADLSQEISRLEQMVERIAKIIHGLRAFSRNADKDPIRPVSLQSVIADTLALCRSRFEACSVDLRIGSIPDVQVGGRGGQLAQILLNLLSNALDAAVDSQERWTSIEVKILGSGVQVVVNDSGHGIPPELASRIMEPFFTTKDVDKGTGLGLSIAKGLAEDHGGSLVLDTSASHTSFVLELKIVSI